ncbi:type II toxin-antitoxin system HipA family toxin YjjJ [Chromobacterium alticapitis]|uniref:Phosphatidylinositol kinase n=1 Tax=Chromobacterium alticapitis TaxID=2073169 RepID=A0A2S5DJ33_9NEIS|nr:type II toxin-antitoxin system HipA family toxin YjjJ [Chromobacterium alticapitis]POZ63054.1 phosphatidylinositol kinase [Chromobacterium alticapitis]
MLVESILSSLRTGPKTAAELCGQLGISQPTLSRRLLDAGTKVIRVGRARATRYFAVRLIGGHAGIPIYRVSQEGRLEDVGELTATWPGFALVRPDGEATHYDGLPWWLNDMRPQGYLGRAWARRLAAQSAGWSADLKDWTDEQVLLALASGEVDMPGNLLIGEEARSRWLTGTHAELISTNDRARYYLHTAKLAESGTLPGSSAGGEQPKFTACVAGREILVKFSASSDNEVSRRWRDLLLAEHIALRFLSAHGFEAAQSEVIDVGTQRFLQVCRFDRNEAGGRRGMVSLHTLDAEFAGLGAGTWPQITAQLLREKSPRSQRPIITPQANETTGRLYAFGTLIGNTDMHAGNLAFYHDGALPLSLAPVYDMLPMGFAPKTGGEMHDALPPFRLPALPAAAIWHEMLQLARAYWQEVMNHPLASPALAAIGARQLGWLNTAAEQIRKAGGEPPQA